MTADDAPEIEADERIWEVFASFGTADSRETLRTIYTGWADSATDPDAAPIWHAAVALTGNRTIPTWDEAWHGATSVLGFEAATAEVEAVTAFGQPPHPTQPHLRLR